MYLGDDRLVHIIRDSFGEIGTITIEDVEEILSGEAAQTITPDGYSILSLSEKGYNMIIPGTDGVLYVVIVSQVRNIIDKWSRRKAALWIPIG